MLYVARYLIELQAGHWLFAYFYRTQVRSLATLVSNLLTNWLTFSRLDWCGPGVWRCQLKRVEVVTVANVDNEDRVGNSSLQIWELRFGQKAKLLFRLWTQGLVILKLAADVWLRLRSWILFKILKLGLVKILSLSIVEILIFFWDFEVNA